VRTAMYDMASVAVLPYGETVKLQDPAFSCLVVSACPSVTTAFPHEAAKCTSIVLDKSAQSTW